MGLGHGVAFVLRSVPSFSRDATMSLLIPWCGVESKNYSKTMQHCAKSAAGRPLTAWKMMGRRLACYKFPIRSPLHRHVVDLTYQVC